MLVQSHHTVHYRRSIFTCTDSILSPDPGPDSDIHYFIQSPVNVQNSLNEFSTLLIDLKQEENKIWDAIYHRTRSEINSFLSNHVYLHHLKFDLTKKELKEYIRLFNHFAHRKHIRKAEVQRLKAYLKSGILAVSYIKEGEAFLWINFYRVTKERATNLYSFRGNSTFNSSHIGRAHRALHWLDILEFKKLKIDFYDFCGWYTGNTNQELLNINAFKEQFTKLKVKEYSGAIYKNKFVLFLLKFIK